MIVWRQFPIDVSTTPTPKAQGDTGKRLLKTKQNKKTGEQEI